MRTSLVFASVACISALAAPVAEPNAEVAKRGGYFDGNGKWVDDGYWAATNGMKQAPPAGWKPWDGNATPSEASSASTSTYNSGGSGGGNSGTATWYYQNGNAGSCGQVHGDGDMIVALDSSYGGGHCGQSVHICNSNSGSCATAVVADTCPTCGGGGNMDLSRGTFGAVCGGADGTCPITWSFS